MAKSIKLPPGFVLDEPQGGGNNSSVNLPPGFVLDQPGVNVESRNPGINISPQAIGSVAAGPVGLQPKPEDIPGMAASLINGVAFNQPRTGLQFPNLMALSGPGGANMAQGSNLPHDLSSGLSDLIFLASGGKYSTPVAPQFMQTSGYENLMPQAVTPGGMVASNLLELGGGILSGNALNNTSKMKTPQSYKNSKNPVEFAQKVRNSMFETRSKLGSQLDESITSLSKANPEKRIDLSGVMQQLKDALADADNPGLRADVMRSIRKIKDPETVKRLNQFINNPKYAESVNLRTAEDMKRAIQQGISAKMGDRFAIKTPGDYELIDLVDEIKDSQAVQFKELSEIRKPYADFMSNYRKVKNLFKEGRLIGKIQTKFGDPEVEQMITKVLPAEIIKEIGGVRRAIMLINAAKKAGWGIAGASVIGAGAKILK